MASVDSTFNAYEIPGIRFSLPAGGVVPRYTFVSIDPQGKGVVANGTSLPVIGSSQNEVTDNYDIDDQVLEICGDGIAIVTASAEITIGALVGCTADGQANVASDAASAVGIAMTHATGADILMSVKYM